MINDTEMLIVDDHAIIRRGMKFILDSNFKGCHIDEAETGKELIQKIQAKTHSHLILDLQLQDCNVISLFSTIREMHPDLLVLIYSMSPEEIFGKRLMQMGAMGYLSKRASEEEVIKALQLFLLRRKYISEKMHELMKNEEPGEAGNQNPFDELSERELAVAHNLLRGRSVKEIAGELDLKSSTVATYKARIFDKLGVTNIMDLHNIAQLFHLSN